METNIGVFDSGIGGVTVLIECVKLNPNFNYYYYSDSFHNPYGDKKSSELIDFSCKIVDYFISKNCHIIVIACNTASAICLNYLKEKYKDIYFIGIEPALKLAYDNSNKGTLVMATRGTLNSEKFKNLFKHYGRDNFYLFSCLGLADLIESGENDKINNYLNNNLLQFKGKVSNVVLGCTHYPLIKKEIKKVLGNVTFYDGSNGVARRLQEIIIVNNFSGCGNSINFIDSSGDYSKEKRFYSLMEVGYE